MSGLLHKPCPACGGTADCPDCAGMGQVGKGRCPRCDGFGNCVVCCPGAVVLDFKACGEKLKAKRKEEASDAIPVKK